MCTAGYSLKTGQQSCEGKTLRHSYSHTYSTVEMQVVLKQNTYCIVFEQAWALSCFTLFMRESEEFHSTRQTNLTPWCQCLAPLWLSASTSTLVSNTEGHQ